MSSLVDNIDQCVVVLSSKYSSLVSELLVAKIAFLEVAVQRP